VGFALGYKNLAFSEGFDDSSEARVTLSSGPDGPVAEVHTAAVEMGQGLTNVLTQIVRTELGVERVVVHPADSGVGSAGSTSASRQTVMSGGAVQMACGLVRDQLAARAAANSSDADELADLLVEPVSCTAVFHHRPTEPFDEDGQGDIHVAFSFAAQRVVVEVDDELGLVRLVQVATAMDVGHVVNPLGVEGQVEGGTAQGIGLALTESIQLRDGVITNPSFTDYLVPTILDVPPMVSVNVAFPEPGFPYGAKGIGESPTVVAPAAVAAALRSATGRELNRIPVTPERLAGLAGPVETSGPPPVPTVPGQRSVPEYSGLASAQQSLASGDGAPATGTRGPVARSTMRQRPNASAS
jgi:CO/xanthine dehydrogenase Mo-binding subunit